MIKAIGRATGCTVNDVLLAAVAGALRNYAIDRDQPVEGLNIRGVIPVNLRQEETRIELGNKFGLVFLALPLGIADPFDRLMEVKRRMDDLKSSQEAVVAFAILNAIGMAPTEIENIVVDIFGAKATAVITNVPGPRQQIYIAGAPVRQLMFWVPQSGRLGIGVSILSYDDRVWLGVATDVSLIPDPDAIVQYYHDELDGLHQMVRQAEAIERFSDGKEGSDTAAGDDFTRIPGIDGDCAAHLQGAGIRTYAQLAASTPEALTALIQAPDWRRPDYAGWIAAAEQLQAARSA
jgi:WS/DGAT/MGAT family acyltransferase